MNPGIYVHLPFCKVHCSYCDFPLTTQQSLASRYYSALLKEITMQSRPQFADTLYFGGGTPSLTPPEMLEEVKSRFTMAADAEVTLEANPDDISPETLEAWKGLGVNRLSLGIQSLEEAALKSMLRVHSAAEAVRSILLAQQAGFQNLNVDLMIGTPGQTEEGILLGLQKLIEFRPQHFSVYFLELHDRTLLHRQVLSGNFELMPEEGQIRSYSEAVRLLQKSGYEHYEVSNFALPGKASRHNLKYWTGAPYFAYGAGACSYVGSTRTNNVASVGEYMEAIENNELPIASIVQENKETRMRNFLIFGLRKRDGVDLSEFQTSFGMSPLALFPADGRGLLESGMLEITGNRLRLTFTGMLVSNEILSLVV